MSVLVYCLIASPFKLHGCPKDYLSGLRYYYYVPKLIIKLCVNIAMHQFEVGFELVISRFRLLF